MDQIDLLHNIDALRAKLQIGVPLYSIESNVNSPLLKLLLEYSKSTGVSLLDVLHEVSVVIKQIIDTKKQIDSAIAAPQLTSRIMQFLPLLSFPLGFMLGVNLFAVLFGSVYGFVLLISAILFLVLGIKLTNNMLNKFGEKYLTNNISDFSDFAMLDSRIIICLIQCSVKSGMNMMESIKALGLKGCEKLAKGIPWKLCGLPSYLDFLEESFLLCLSPIEKIKTQINYLNTEQINNAQISANKLSVKMVLPLGLCYLPSFILIGVVPIIISLVVNL